MNRFLAYRSSVIATKLALAVSLRLMLGAAPLNAAEQPVYTQLPTPLEIARQLGLATAGGLYDPNQPIPFDRHSSQSASGDQHNGDAQDLPVLFDRHF